MRVILTLKEFIWVIIIAIYLIDLLWQVAIDKFKGKKK